MLKRICSILGQVRNSLKLIHSYIFVNWTFVIMMFIIICYLSLQISQRQSAIIDALMLACISVSWCCNDLPFNPLIISYSNLQQSPVYYIHIVVSSIYCQFIILLSCTMTSSMMIPLTTIHRLVTSPTISPDDWLTVYSLSPWLFGWPVSIHGWPITPPCPPCRWSCRHKEEGRHGRGTPPHTPRQNQTHRSPSWRNTCNTQR